MLRSICTSLSIASHPLRYRWIWALALSLLCTLSLAQKASLPEAGLEISGIDVLPNTPQGISLAEVLSDQAGAFIKHEGAQVHHPHWYRGFWLRIQLKRSQLQPAQPQQALLTIPKPYLDTVRLFTPGDALSPSWKIQAHGDFMPPDSWTSDTLYPQFTLPTAADLLALPNQQLTLYMQVDHIAPVMIGVQLASVGKTRRSDLANYTIYGMLFGAILLTALLTASQAWLNRDPIYIWYSGYAVSAMLACLSHSGVAQQLFWRVGGYWPGTAVLFFLMFCCAFQMQFARGVRDLSHQPRWQTWGTYLLSACCVMLAIAFPFFDAHWRTMYFMLLGLVAMTTVAATFLMIQAWRAGIVLAKAWFLAFSPLWLTVLLALMEGIGLLPTEAWSYNAAIYALGIEVLVIGFALQWFARARHGQIEREKALATTDPLTGFANAEQFRKDLAQGWARSLRSGRDMAIVYVSLQTQATQAVRSEMMLTRSVRVLRTATHSHDIVARLDGSLLAVLMPDIGFGDDLGQRLSRIVALGLMPDPNQQNSILQFRIAATTRKQYGTSPEPLDADLKKLLTEPNGWGSKPIRYIDRQAPAIRPTNADLETSVLEDLWDKALVQEKHGATKSP
jgi:two-component system, sensor histidine kinase LadS